MTLDRHLYYLLYFLDNPKLFFLVSAGTGIAMGAMLVAMVATMVAMVAIATELNFVAGKWLSCSRLSFNF